MPNEEYEFAKHSKLMQPDEIFTIASLFVSKGVNKIRLTGGEPLVRKDAGKILDLLATLPVELTLTTNGIFVNKHIDRLKNAGVKSLNISLDTLQAEKFHKITRRDQFQLVMDNIQLLIKENFRVKINVVIMKDFNDNEILDFIDWTKNKPVEVRFIEFMPFTGNKWTSNQVISLEEILEIVATKYKFEPIKGSIHDTAKAYSVAGHLGTFAIISTMTQPFCAGCNRMRLTADGKMKNCLFSNGETDLLSALRKGEEIEPLIFGNIKAKAKELGGQFTTNMENIQTEDIHNRSMITIGG